MKNILTFILLVVLLQGCDEASRTSISLLPDEAGNIKDIGNGWISFKWRDQCFIYSMLPYDRSLSRVLATVECDGS